MCALYNSSGSRFYLNVGVFFFFNLFTFSVIDQKPVLKYSFISWFSSINLLFIEVFILISLVVQFGIFRFRLNALEGCDSTVI